MTAAWRDDTRCFYTVDEFAALPEDNSMRFELLNGRMVASPRPLMPHMVVIAELYGQLKPQLPDGMLAVTEIDLDLQLTRPVVRIPDLVILDARAVRKPGIVKAEDVLLAVEVLSPSSVRTDTKIKPLQYADAGIPNLWVVGLRPSVTVTVHRLVDGNYEKSQHAEHALLAHDPCELRVDLDSLLPAMFR
jgi:Uma2 family endonuclease